MQVIVIAFFLLTIALSRLANSSTDTAAACKVSVQDMERQKDQKAALGDALKCLQKTIIALEAKIKKLSVPEIMIGDASEKGVDKWFQVPSDGFLSVRVGGNGGAVASAWCDKEPRKTGNRILNIRDGQAIC